MLALGSARQGWVQGGDSSGCGADRACVNLGGHGDAGRREVLSPGGASREPQPGSAPALPARLPPEFSGRD